MTIAARHLKELRMNYSDYINGISFRLYKPQTKPRGYIRLERWLRRCGFSLEAMNTRLPDDAKVSRTKLARLCDMPKMSTFAIAAMINRGVSLMSADSCYVNVGVWNGFTFLAGMVNNEQKKCIGIDTFSEFGGPRDQFLARFNKSRSSNHYFYDLDYVEYFSKIHQGKIGFYVYDGDHSYENQLKGLQIAEPFFSDDCLILIDDTNWEEPRQATLDFVAQSPQKYEIILDKTTFHNSHPTLWNGVMVLQKITRA